MQKKKKKMQIVGKRKTRSSRSTAFVRVVLSLSLLLFSLPFREAPVSFARASGSRLYNSLLRWRRRRRRKLKRTRRGAAT